MTDVTGLLLKEAKKEIAARNSELLIQVKKEYSESVRKGYVIGQSVAANTTFQEGEIETIVLTVSKGSQKVVVPDVTGMLKEDAMKKIHKAGLKYKIAAYSQNDTVAFGAVIRQKPVEGEKAKKGSYVKIWVSLG
ncbi:MAG: PASTA domain-containing protein [Clostridiaceae bacterium]|nr:PASTA domain-containing protein [Clostridiaceae bacterium]